MAASSKSSVTARNSKIVARNLLQDSIAGIIASVVLIANIVSFGALMFPGQLSAGIPAAIWTMLIGSAVGGIVVASLLARIGAINWLAFAPSRSDLICFLRQAMPSSSNT